jgi:vacuolar-type H+-ATPase subunit I/STV1
MKRFASFLLEKTNANQEEATLVLHKIYGGFDTAHIEKKPNHSELNVGQVIKDKNYKTLNMVFRAGQENARLASKGDEFFIVVEYPKYSGEVSRDDLLNKIEEQQMAGKVKQAIVKFLDEARDEFHEKNKETTYEIKSKDNDEVDARYDALMKAYANKLNEYKSAIAELDKTANSTANAAKQTSANMAKQAIKKEYFGDSFKRFLSILTQLPEGKFISNLESETKKKVLARLENFYDHYVEK